MKNINSPQPMPEQFIKILCSGPKIQPTGIFWHAFDGIKKCNQTKARALFETEYIKPPDEPDESARTAQIFSLSNGIPLYTRDFGWVEVFAAAGLTDALGELVEAQCVQAMHALHAELELAPRFFPNPTLQITEREANCLLLTYELEAEVIMASSLASHHVEKWLNERSQRAADYLGMLGIESASLNAANAAS